MAALRADILPEKREDAAASHEAFKNPWRLAMRVVELDDRAILIHRIQCGAYNHLYALLVLSSAWVFYPRTSGLSTPKSDKRPSGVGESIVHPRITIWLTF
jgi:hypothetical protein